MGQQWDPIKLANSQPQITALKNKRITKWISRTPFARGEKGQKKEQDRNFQKEKGKAT